MIREIQPDLDFRTEEELAENILKKRKSGLPLDPREAKLALRQAQEDREEMEATYRKPKN